jgi:UDPglucose 6-dehydrogenase
MMAEGATITATDIAAMDQARTMLDITFCPTMEETVRDADALILMTEWPTYVQADLPRLRRLMKGHAVADLRRGWSKTALQEAGFRALYRVGE